VAQQERAIRTRERILLSAAEVFDETGYDAATISEILKRSQVTKGALYFHFTSKQELAQAVLASQLASVPPVPQQDLVLQEGLDSALLLAHLLSQGDPMVRGSIRLTVDQVLAHDGLDRRVPMQGWTDSNVAILEKARQNGELMQHVNIETAAKLFVGAFTGVQILSKIMTNHADMVERVLDLQQHLLTSIAVPPVLVRLDFAPDRAQRVYEAALKLQAERAPAPV
jgi:AcrR family transcriptional regulator